MSDKHRLGAGAISLHDGTEGLVVASHGGGAGLGEGLEAEADRWSAPASCLCRVGFAHGELADLKAQEVESGGFARVDPQGMADAGFARVELQADLLKPRGGMVRELFDDAEVGMQDDEV